jgi:hypothetical protein
MNDDVLSELRRANPITGPMAALPIETVLRRLDDEPASHVPRWRRAHRGTQRMISAVSVAISVGVVVLVVAVVILAGGGHSTNQAANSTRPTSPRAELIRALAVVRNPQISADRDRSLERGLGLLFLTPTRPRLKFLARYGSPKPDRPLLREVTVPSLRAHVLIAPTTYRPVRSSRRRSEGINLYLMSPGNNGTGTGPNPAAVRSFLTHGLSLFVVEEGSKANPGVVLVPDGVARVAFGPATPRPSQTPYRVNPAAIARATAMVHVTSTVHDNIAAFNLTVPTIVSPKAFSGTSAIAATTPTTWYAANGTVIRRTTTQISVSVNIIGLPRPLPPFCKHFPRRARRQGICKR